jgi:hypothetical protein
LGKGTKAPSSGAATGPGAGSKNTAEDLKRD